MRKLFLVFIFLVVLINGCVNKNAYSCSTDDDCVVKDVHNCCGYFPRCVNKDYTPDVEAVKKNCQDKGFASICGWSVITNCTCVENTCKSMQGDTID